MPNYWDNWDVDPHCVCEVVESGPIRATLKVSTLLLPKVQDPSIMEGSDTERYEQEATLLDYARGEPVVKLHAYCTEPPALFLEAMDSDLERLIHDPTTSSLHQTGGLTLRIKMKIILEAVISINWTLRISLLRSSEVLKEGKKHSMKFKHLGTYYYLAPELLEPQAKFTSFATDVFAFSHLMFEVLTESYPWGNLSEEEWHAKVLKGNPLEIPARIFLARRKGTSGMTFVDLWYPDWLTSGASHSMEVLPWVRGRFITITPVQFDTLRLPWLTLTYSVYFDAL
ncbi:hypothetical protein Pelo_3130 [Pelomyxa schiedti]|nr:hypothetical protein Pelo_3130 [Pelomyxa schiedti]